MGEGTTADFDAAFPELYHRAYRVAFRLCGTHPDAEDLAQEALARAYGRWEKVSRYDDPAAWVARVVTNLSFDWRRRRRSRQGNPRPPTVLESAPDHVDLYRALASLPRRQRQTVVLRYLADQSEQSTAAALGCSVGAIKRHAHRGLTALRRRLALEEE